MIESRLDELRTQERQDHRQDRERTDRRARRAGHRGRGRGPPEAALFRLAQDGAQIDRLRAIVRHFRLPRHRRTRSRIAIASSASSIPNGRPCRAASRITSRRRSRTIITRSTRPSSARAVSASSCRCAPHDDARHRRIRHRRACALQGRHASPTARRWRSESRAYQWLRRTIEMLAEGDTPEEFLEHTKLELFHDQVFCFTPKGRLIALPRGATPIDFAYAVHTDVGNSRRRRQDQRPHRAAAAPNCRTATRSRSSAPKARRRRRSGKRLSSPARRAPRSAARRAMRCGRNMPGSDARSLRAPSSGPASPTRRTSCKAALPRLARADVEDVLAAVGRGEMFSGDVVKAVYPEFTEERKAGAGAPARRRRAGSA